jgi:hypothetical protein
MPATAAVESVADPVPPSGAVAGIVKKAVPGIDDAWRAIKLRKRYRDTLMESTFIPEHEAYPINTVPVVPPMPDEGGGEY